jgi:hypothetical protein
MPDSHKERDTAEEIRVLADALVQELTQLVQLIAQATTSGLNSTAGRPSRA